MKAGGYIKKESKRLRDREKHILEGAKLCWKAIMVKANDEYGFGNIRGGRLVQGSADLISYVVNRYSGDCAETALDKMLSDRGLRLDLHTKG